MTDVTLFSWKQLPGSVENLELEPVLMPVYREALLRFGERELARADHLVQAIFEFVLNAESHTLAGLRPQVGERLGNGRARVKSDGQPKIRRRTGPGTVSRRRPHKPAASSSPSCGVRRGWERLGADGASAGGARFAGREPGIGSTAGPEWRLVRRILASLENVTAIGLPNRLSDVMDARVGPGVDGPVTPLVVCTLAHFS
jgi:hypothetical protein